MLMSDSYISKVKVLVKVNPHPASESGLDRYDNPYITGFVEQSINISLSNLILYRKC